MADLLTDSLIKALPAPATGNRITYDEKVKGFGVRITAAGTRAFILNYRTRSGRERRFTIGSFPDWKVAAARNEASELKKRVDRGEDPMAEVEADRDAKTMADLSKRFRDEHLPKKRAATKRDYEAMIDNEILPALKHIKVAEVTFSDVDDLHRKITKRGTPYRANRVVAVLSKMFSLAIQWKWRPDNPAKGIERNGEVKRSRYLSAAEIKRLSAALSEHEDQQAANIIRLLLLTGARRGEVQGARWADIDLDGSVWTKPGATTKQKAEHRVPLSSAAVELLTEIRAAAKAKAEKDKAEMSPYVFPGRGGEAHRVEIKGDWADICTAAALTSVRMHDLRHTYASVLASSGASLPLIGALLGHTQPATTHRYAHLLDDPLRAATERVSDAIAGK